jgi:hypothetical protein
LVARNVSTGAVSLEETLMEHLRVVNLGETYKRYPIRQSDAMM